MGVFLPISDMPVIYHIGVGKRYKGIKLSERIVLFDDIDGEEISYQ